VGKMESKERVDIIKNIHSIESLKVNILAGVTRVYDSLNKGKEDLAVDYIIGLMITLFRLGKRLGISYRKLDQKLVEKVNTLDVDGSIELKEDIEELKQYLMARGE
jgi:hypothetical protein